MKLDHLLDEIQWSEIIQARQVKRSVALTVQVQETRVILP